MHSLQKYKNKKIAIYGFGITGESAAIVLKKLGAKVLCWDDSKEIRKKIEEKKFILNKFWLKKKSIDNIVVSPGINIEKCKIKNYFKKNPQKIITDLDIFFHLNQNTSVISITGTNGKSTTCKIIEKILKKARYKVNTVGNIGKPILSLKKLKNNFLILEVSSYQLEYSKLFRSKYAAILNISPDHLDRHKNIDNYIKIKSKIFFLQNKSDFSYINSTNKYSNFIKKIFKDKKLSSKLIYVNKLKSKPILKKINNNYFTSAGNIENLSFAYNIAKQLNISDQIIITALKKFKGLPHRQEIIISNKKLLCINDSKATSFDATMQSLSNYNKIYWIVGGVPKEQDSFYLKYVKNNIYRAYIIGDNIAFYKKQIGKSIPYIVSKNLKNAVNSIYGDFKKDNDLKKTILLSPAGASFDQFKNFEDRGNYFKKLIGKKFNV